MTQDEWERVKAVFGLAWEQPASDRSAFIASHCTGDERLRLEVESLVQSAAEAEALYETPFLSVPDALGAVDDVIRTDPLVGARVDAYRIVRELGRGGMGAVYLAERADGEFEQQVAIKFVAGDLASAALRQRFREERRILAALDHPNIARLLDGGTTPGGQPYVVMEYVAGIPITEFCGRTGLSIRGRLELFRTVCGAVHHAHQRMVVHRDIKAGNILVTADGMPKLLDFGIATLTDPAGPAAPRARTMIRAHTPESASPEQIRGEPATAATDVYALGVLLYSLLAGRGPYGDTATLSDAELARTVCDIMPPPPSLVATAHRPGAAIDRDLDLIVLEAIRKEPDRRYRSADAFSEDLKRYLDGRPVLAAPDTRRYRTQKFVRRHRVAVAGAAAALMAVLGGASTAVYQARIASRERARAERRFDDVRKLASSFLFEFHDAIVELPGTLPARQLVVKRAAEYLDRLAGEAQDNVPLQRELATAYERLGEILGGSGTSNLGDLQGAEARYRSALSLRESLVARPRPDTADIEGLARLRVLLSRPLLATGRIDQSEKSAADAVALLEAHRIGGQAVSADALAVAYHQLGWVQARRKKSEALESLRRGFEFAARHVDSHPQDTLARARLARNETDYADGLRAAGRASEAVVHASAARRLFEQLAAAEPLNTRHRQNLALAFGNEAHALSAQGDPSAALEARAHAVEVAEQLLAIDPDNQGNLITVMLNHYELATLLLSSEQRASGLQRLRQAIAEGEAIVRASPDYFYMATQLAAAKLDLAGALLASDSRSAEGCRSLDEGLATLKTIPEAGGQVPEEMVLDRARLDGMLARCRNRAAASLPSRD